MRTVIPHSSALLAECLPPKVRHLIEWAEQTIVLPPGGPCAGQNFSVLFQPWTEPVLILIHEAIHSTDWDTFAAAGPTQVGKTTAVIAIPLGYALFELRWHCGLAAPKLKEAKKVWREKIEPSLRNPSTEHYWPKSGRGSGGGDADEIYFTNGAALHFFGTQDKPRSTTVQAMFATETEQMRRDHLEHLEARMGAYGDRALLVLECMVEEEDGAIYEVVTQGTDTRLMLLCPICETHVHPERKHLVGWQDAKDEVEARKHARIVCPKCGGEWGEKERRQSFKGLTPVHRGQEIKAGKVVGEIPETMKLGVQWNCVPSHSEMVPLARVAAQEWSAKRSADPVKEIELRKTRWTLPAQITGHVEAVEISQVLSRVTERSQGIVPPGTRVTAFMDLGKRDCWWVVWAWTMRAEGFLVDYGHLSVNKAIAVDDGLFAVLAHWRDEILPRYFPALVLVDAGWHPTIAKDKRRNVASDFCHVSGSRFWAWEGYGYGKTMPNWTEKSSRGKTLKPGNNCREKIENGRQVFQADTDYWKGKVHEGFRLEPGIPGSLVLPTGNHRIFAEHHTAERMVWDEVKQRWIWDPIGDRPNHLFDGTVGCRCGVESLGVRTSLPPPPKEKAKPKKSQKPVVQVFDDDDDGDWFGGGGDWF